MKKTDAIKMARQIAAGRAVCRLHTGTRGHWAIYRNTSETWGDADGVYCEGEQIGQAEK